MENFVTDGVLLNIVAWLRLLCSGATRNKGGSKGLISTEAYASNPGTEFKGKKRDVAGAKIVYFLS